MKYRTSSSTLLVLLSVSLLLCLYACGRPAAPPMLAPSSGEHPVLPETDDEREARDEWLYFQRAYPFGHIPAGARRQAWLARPGADLKTLAVGQTWKAIGPNPISSAPLANWGLTSGRIKAVAVSPSDSQLVLVGGSDGGIWRSTDGGIQFLPVADD